MVKYIVIGILVGILVGCGSVPKNTTQTEPEVTVFDDIYYQNLKRNIVRLYHLMQGTFIAYAETEEDLKSWNVTEGDSVVLYTTTLGDVNKHGYWLYSYEFMTSLPDAPIYTGIKQIKAVSRDSFEVLYYKTDAAPLKFREVLNPTLLNERIKLHELEQVDKKVIYVRNHAANFIGRSILYEDNDCLCLRQNLYNILPKSFKVSTEYYDTRQKQKLNKKKRPNFMIRRAMSTELLEEIANKGNLSSKRKR